ncbi:[Fe-Fe] hydrogenase large subunit C-terminal domain-containing protein [Clostridium sp. B9]|uniref:[Fe-Fe] hydrogenase large subunit C-terminal domain-containing protein n=1 Tax=Clostridium sp. B9 TaxID=3423224 RepID=UPI003D2F4E21
MNKKYEPLLKELISSYYSNDDFDKKLNNIIEHDFNNREEAIEILSSLCGVDIDNKSKNISYALKKAITSHKVKNNLVSKVSLCTEDCHQDNGKAKCQSLCPFDAILTNPIDNGKYIDPNLCESCGICVQVCENGHFLDRIEIIPIVDLLKNNEKVIAAVAPAIAGQFGENVTLDMLREAFIKIGFADMIEVAFAADMLSIKEAVEFNHHVEKTGDVLITSCCCPMWVGMLRKCYNDLVKDVSPSVSPMIAAARVIKKLSPDAKVVFIGPCIAKKAEAREKDLVGSVDYVLTFEELKGIFDVLKIDPSSFKGVPSIEYTSRGGRLYARTGGVSEAIHDVVKELYPEKDKLFTAVQANGVKECKELLTNLQNGEINATFIEGMGCIGGCVGGPKRIVDASIGKKCVDKVAYDSPIKVATHSHTMDEVLSRLGINSLKSFEEKEKIEIFEREF